jgi:hypothetical protein
MGRILNWFKGWSLPTIFGWAALAFGDRLKLLAFLIQAGAGIALTAFAAWAMYWLAGMRAIWPVFYLGFGALCVVAIVITGFGALLYKRNVKFNVFGASFEAADQEAAVAMAHAAQTIQENKDVQRTDK